MPFSSPFSGGWASSIADVLNDSFQNDKTHTVTVKAKSTGGASVKASTSLTEGKAAVSKAKFAVKNFYGVALNKIEFGTKSQYVKLEAAVGKKVHTVDGLNVVSSFEHHGNGSKPTSFSTEVQFDGVQDLGVSVKSNVTDFIDNKPNLDAVIGYSLADVKLATVINYNTLSVKGADGKKALSPLAWTLAAQYNGGDWNAFHKSVSSDAGFDVKAMKHSSGFDANLNKDTRLVGLVNVDASSKTPMEILLGGVQKIDGASALAWKLSSQDVSLNYKHKLTGSMTVDASTKLPYDAKAGSSIAFGLTYSP